MVLRRGCGISLRAGLYPSRVGGKGAGDNGEGEAPAFAMVSFCVWERAKSAQTLSCCQEKNKQPLAEGWRPQAARWTWVLCGGQICLSQALLGSLCQSWCCVRQEVHREKELYGPCRTACGGDWILSQGKALRQVVPGRLCVQRQPSRSIL